jgi:hypothetical protein
MKTSLVAILFAFALCCTAARTNAASVFEDATEAVKLSGVSGTAIAWGDFNNDGWVDLYDGVSLWRNESGKQFSKVPNQPMKGSGIWGDFDNDGYLDLYCWDNSTLFRNNKGVNFEEAGGTMPKHNVVSRGAAWGDFDGDGFLDLYVGGYEVWGKTVYPDFIYRNQGDGHFAEIWTTQGKNQSARGITAADYDEDGDLDIYVSNYRLEPNLLWQNNGKGVFNDIAKESGVAGDGDLGAWGHTIGSAWGDFDNDGHFDVFVGNFSHPPSYQDRPKFLRNLGAEKQWQFEDKSAQAGLHWQESYASPTLGDFDNDGLLDLFFTTVYPGDTSVLYRNADGWKFTNATQTSGITTATTYQAAWADFDNDGDLDLMSGGRLWRNTSEKRHWLKVSLRGGGKINRSAIGAQVRLQLPTGVLTRQVEGGTGEGNQNDLTLHFGLGNFETPVELTVAWPDGSKQNLKSPVDRLVAIEYNAQ